MNDRLYLAAPIVACLVASLGLMPLGQRQTSREPRARAAHAPTPVGWTWFPAGTFQMGCVPGDRECHANETPRHTVVLTGGFFVMLTEVTIGMFAEHSRSAGVRLPRQPFWNDTDDHPVVNIMWDEARRFCAGAFRGRLPTEAEWEYAARGGASETRYPWGNDYRRLLVNGARGDAWRQAAPVGSFPPNRRGLFDVVGNVWEWTDDWYHPSYFRRSAREDPRGAPAGQDHSIRGGSWDSAARQLRLSSRRGLSARGRHPLYIGFRCVADGPEAPPVLRVPSRLVIGTSPRP